MHREIKYTRAYWEHEKGTEETVSFSDYILALLREISKDFCLSFNQQRYIRPELHGQPKLFVKLRPQRENLKFEVKLCQSTRLENLMQNRDLCFNYHDLDGSHQGWYHLHLNGNAICKNKDLIASLLQIAYKQFGT